MKYLSFVAFGTLIIAFLLLLLVGYWLFWPDTIITVQNHEAIPVDKKVYAPGEEIRYTISYCKSREIVGTVYRTIVNSVRIAYTPTQSNLPAGCREVTVAGNVIPLFLDPGTYHLEVTGEYQVNPLRKDINSWRTVDFEIK
jgi:hypothetical protein